MTLTSTERAIVELNAQYLDNKQILLGLQAKLRQGVKDWAQSQSDLYFALDYIEDQGERISVGMGVNGYKCVHMMLMLEYSSVLSSL